MSADLALATRQVRTLILARWLGAVFGAVQVFSYATMPYPPGVRTAALVIVGAIVATNLAFMVARRAATDLARVRRLSFVVLVTDVVILSALTWVYAFDDVSALFAVLFLLPVEGAVLFGFAGAIGTWLAVAVLYVGREFYALQFGNPIEPDSVTFRVGLIGIVAFVVGSQVRDLVAQRRATAEALEASRRLEESRARLVSMMAHDVRAPMAAARMAFDTLRASDDELSEKMRRDVITAGRRQVDRAILLARDLLDLARVESDTLEMTPTVVDLEGLVTGVAAVLPGVVDLRVDVAGLSVLADRARLEQVVYNLADNALKYGTQPIEITARRDDGRVLLTIRDHGPGIPDGVELFTAFSHVGEGSVGLGMWIVQELVAANGGTIEHRHASPGAAFDVSLPAAAVEPPASSLSGSAAAGTPPSPGPRPTARSAHSAR